jgi:hypothetical protein
MGHCGKLIEVFERQANWFEERRFDMAAAPGIPVGTTNIATLWDDGRGRSWGHQLAQARREAGQCPGGYPLERQLGHDH